MPLPLRHENSSVGAQCGTRCYWSTPTQSDRGTGACHLGHRNSLALGPPVGEGSGWRGRFRLGARAARSLPPWRIDGARGRFRLGASMARAVASALAHRWRARSLPPWRAGARGRFRLGARARSLSRRTVAHALESTARVRVRLHRGFSKACSPRRTGVLQSMKNARRFRRVRLSGGRGSK